MPVSIGNAVAVPTFQCGGIVCEYTGTPVTSGNAVTDRMRLPARDASVVMEFRKGGTATWIPTIPLYCDTKLKQFRGSFLWLQPKTEYEVRLTAIGGNALNFVMTTMDDNPPSIGRVFYVSPTGNDSNNGSQAAPWRTLAKAAAMVQAGDIVYVMAGTYAGFSMSINGASNNYITFSRYQSDLVTVTGQVLFGASYNRIRGINANSNRAARGTSDYAYFFNGATAIGNILEDFESQATGASSYGSCIGIFNSAKQCLIQRGHMTVTGNPDGNIEDKNGVYWWRDSGNHVFRNLLIDGVPWDGLGGGPEDLNTTCNNNDFHDIKVVEAWDDGIQPEGGIVNTRAWSNTMRSCMLGYTDAANNILGPAYFFRTQVCADKTKRGEGNNGLIGSGNAEDILATGRVYNFQNSFWGMAGSVGLSAKNYGVANKVFINNIIDTDRYAIEWGHDPDGTNCIVTRNILRHRDTEWNLIKWGAAATGDVLENNLEDIDPKFVNGATGDFNLQDGSPAIEAGIVIPQVNDENSPWPYSGSAPDMGAIEAGSAPPVQYALIIAITGQGSTIPGAGTTLYTNGSQASIVASPAAGWKFTGWTENGVTIGTDPTLNLTMNQAHSITAIFEQIIVPPTIYTLALSTTDGGVIDPEPGTYSYNENSLVNLVAIPFSGYIFKEWRLGGVTLSTNPNYTLVMTGNMSIEAIFEVYTPPPANNSLIITVIGEGSTSPAPGMSTYLQGITVSVTATPAPGYKFVAWREGVVVVSTLATFQVTMSRDVSLVAVFETIPPIQRTLSLVVLGNGITSPAGNTTYADGTTVNVSAIPDPGNQFIEWQEAGITVSTNPVYPVKMTANRSLVAIFQIIVNPPEQNSLVITIVGRGSTSPAPGMSLHVEGASVVVKATPDAGSVFLGWSEGAAMLTTEQEYTALMDTDRSLVAVFGDQVIPPQYYTLLISALGPGLGEPEGVTTYQSGSEVLAAAIANPGCRFLEWREGSTVVSQDAAYKFTIDRNRSLVAVFEEVPIPPEQVSLTMAKVGEGTITPDVGTHLVNAGNTVIIEATPATGWTFEGWQGTFQSASPTTEIGMAENATQIAVFTQAPLPAVSQIPTALIAMGFLALGSQQK